MIPLCTMYSDEAMNSNFILYPRTNMHQRTPPSGPELLNLQNSESAVQNSTGVAPSISPSRGTETKRARPAFSERVISVAVRQACSIAKIEVVGFRSLAQQMKLLRQLADAGPIPFFSCAVLAQEGPKGTTTAASLFGSVCFAVCASHVEEAALSACCCCRICRKQNSAEVADSFGVHVCTPCVTVRRRLNACLASMEAMHLSKVSAKASRHASHHP